MFENDVDDWLFVLVVYACVFVLSWKVIDDYFVEFGCEDLCDLLVCSVDFLGCKDIDDVLSVCDIDDECIEIGVYIVDVMLFLFLDIVMDEEAARRGMTTYLV